MNRIAMIRFSSYQLKALQMLRCPRCTGELRLAGSALLCDTCGASRAVTEEGIVDMLGGVLPRLSPAQRIGQWRLTARMYDPLWRRRALSLLSGQEFPPVAELELTAHAIELDRVHAVLDNACANAFYGRELAARMIRRRRHGVFVANDLSLAMLRRAHRMALQEGVADRMLFVRSDSEVMPFASACFDAAVCGGSLNEFLHPGAYLGELRRVLKPGGVAGLMCQIESDAPAVRMLQCALARLGRLRIMKTAETMRLLEEWFVVSASLRLGSVLMTQLVPSTGSSVRKRNGQGVQWGKIVEGLVLN
jgi:ubiquinone/menaquinone biosynthesis C-methylase UbiE